MGYVYLICDPSSDAFKIGVTNKKIDKRIKKLQTGNPEELFISSFYECEYPFRLEKMLHTKFSNKRMHGEWFSLNSHDIGQFRNTCEELIGIIESIKDNPYITLK
jgi:hypothetical protein